MPTRKQYSVAMLYISSIVINIISCLIIWFYKPSVSGPVALHYNVISGFDEIGSRVSLYQLPLLGFAVVFVNLFLAYRLRFLRPHVLSHTNTEESLDRSTQISAVENVGAGYIILVAGASALVVALTIFLASLLIRIQGS